MQSPERYVKIHKLTGGLRAAFVQLPHFRTTSARFIVNSGSLHEVDGTEGAAHFLEHLTFQGTEDIPSEQAIKRFQEENDVYINAETGTTSTMFTAQGFELEPTLHILTQVALFPTLDPNMLENERLPIIEETRNQLADPYYRIRVVNNRAIRGERYVRPITGTVEDVHKLTHEHLVEFYNRNYRLENAQLIVCSSESPDKQREYTESLIAHHVEHGKGQPTPIVLPEFNPKSISSSLQTVDIHDAQTGTTICYGLAKTKTFEEWFPYSTLASILSYLVAKRLRNELKLSYSASAYTDSIVNYNFGANEDWNDIRIGTSLSGENAIPALNAILHDVLQKPLPEDVFNATIRNIRHNAQAIYESLSGDIANKLVSYIRNPAVQTVDMEEGGVFADKLTLQKLRDLQKTIVATKPIVMANSPDAAILEKIDDWTRKNIA